MNYNGRIVKPGNTDDEIDLQINIADFADGMYIMRILSSDNRNVIKKELKIDFFLWDCKKRTYYVCFFY